MRNLNRWLPILLLLATPAGAASKYVSPIGCDSTGYGARADSAFRTLAYALARVGNGDTLYLGHSAGVIASGRYSGPAVVQRHNLTIIGDSLKPNAVVVPGLTVNASSGSQNYGGLYVNGVRFHGNVSVQSFWPYGNVDGLLFRNVRVFGGTYVYNGDASFYASSFGIHRDSCDSYFRLVGDAKLCNWRIDGCTIIAAPVSAPYYTDYGISIRSNRQEAVQVTPNITGSAFTIFHPDTYNPPKPSFLGAWKDGVSSGNTWTFIDSSGVTSTDAQSAFLFRDRLTGNVWLNDTFTLSTLRSGTGKSNMQLVSVGANTLGPIYDSYANTWRYCTFKGNIPRAGQFGFSWVMGDRDSFTRNVVVCSTGVSRGGFSVHNVRGKAYVYRNTFMNIGSGGAVMVNDDQDVCAGHTNCCWLGTLEFKGNIVYTRSTATGSSDYAMGISYPLSASIPAFVSDYNVYSHYGGSGARSFGWANCGETAAVKSIAQFYALTGNDQHSVYGSPKFTDSTWANFNRVLTSGSVAIGAGPGGVDAGAYDYQDQIRPYEVTDLIASAWTTKTVTLTWTDTGADSLTGTAYAYDLRQSTSAITSGNFTSATPVITTFLPGASGTHQNFTVTGLTPQTRYYFAIKLRDEFGNYSAISNLAFTTTNAEGELGTAEP